MASRPQAHVVNIDSKWVEFATFAASILFILLAIGCNARSALKLTQPEDLAQYATLPQVTVTHHAELKAELARVVAEQGTPQQLDRSILTTRPAGTMVAVTHIGSPHNNLRSELAAILPAEIRDRLVKRMEGLYPAGDFRFSPADRRSAHELLQANGELRRAYQQLVLNRKLDVGHAHSLGIGADSSYLLTIEVGNRLQAFHVAELLATDRAASAIEPITAMLRACELLAREKHLTPRLAAAQRRREALAVLAAVGQHPAATAEMHLQLAGILARTLESWPPDTDAWIGERAEGLHTYELVRDGYLLSLIPFEEMQRLRNEIGIDTLGRIVSRNVDADELFFLTSIRRVIDSCAQPFYDRRSMLQSISIELERLRGSDHYPFVADQILLPGFESFLQQQVADRARCEAWHLALRVAAGELVSPPINPLTGQPFTIEQTAERVTVRGLAESELAVWCSHTAAMK